MKMKKMKKKKEVGMSNTKKRIIAGVVMALIAIIAGIAELHGLPAIQYLGVFIVFGMIVEYIICLRRADSKTLRSNWIAFFAFLVLLCVNLYFNELNALTPYPHNKRRNRLLSYSFFFFCQFCSLGNAASYFQLLVQVIP